MRKFFKTILFLFTLSSIAYAEDDGMAVLNKKRAEIEKSEQAKAKKETEDQARLAEIETKEQTKSQTTETIVAKEGMSTQDEQEAMEILEGMRKKIEKEDSETLKLQKEAKELGITTSEASSLGEIEAMVKAKKAEKAKPKTEAEKLEVTRKEALDKLDFYERVVRSVAREEAEVAGYYEIMNDQPKATETAETTEMPVTEKVAPVEETVQ